MPFLTELCITFLEVSLRIKSFYLAYSFTRYYELTRRKCISNANSVMPVKVQPRLLSLHRVDIVHFVEKKLSRSPTAAAWLFSPSSGAFCPVKMCGNPWGRIYSFESWYSSSYLVAPTLGGLRLGAELFLCLGTLCGSVSVASGAQSQVKYPLRR